MDATGPDSDKRPTPRPPLDVDQPIVVGDIVCVMTTGWNDREMRARSRWGRVVAFHNGAPLVDCGGDVGLVHAGHWRKANGRTPD